MTDLEQRVAAALTPYFTQPYDERVTGPRVTVLGWPDEVAPTIIAALAAQGLHLIPADASGGGEGLETWWLFERFVDGHHEWYDGTMKYGAILGGGVEWVWRTDATKAVRLSEADARRMEREFPDRGHATEHAYFAATPPAPTPASEEGLDGAPLTPELAHDLRAAGWSEGVIQRLRLMPAATTERPAEPEDKP